MQDTPHSLWGSQGSNFHKIRGDSVLLHKLKKRNKQQNNSNVNKEHHWRTQKTEFISGWILMISLDFSYCVFFNVVFICFDKKAVKFRATFKT